MTNPYPELAAILSARTSASPTASPAAAAGGGTAAAVALDAAPSVSLATATTAVAQAMAMVDTQVTAVEATNIVPNFPGDQPMIDALGQMKQAAGQWPSIKGMLQAAAQATIGAGPNAATLGVNINDAEILQQLLASFVMGVLQPLQQEYQAAQGAFDNFSANLANTESLASNANAQAVQALDAEQAQIQSQIDDINAKIKDLSSAGSIIIGILSGGISIAVQMQKLKDEEASLQGEEAQAANQKQAYGMAYSQFVNASSAASLAVQATATLNTALEQAVNTLNDVSTSSSGNLIVMQAELTSFRQDFAGAVTASQAMLT